MSSELSVRSELQQQESPVATASKPASRIGRYWELTLGTFILVTLVVGYAAYRAGSVWRAIPYLTGQRFFVTDTQIDLGQVKCGTEVDTTIGLINCGSKLANVVGARKSCGCIALDSFPFEVEADSQRSMQLRMHVPPKPTEFTHTVELYVADQSFSSFHVTLSGKAVEE